VPVGIALSGGLDSGAVALLSAPKYPETMRAFSVGYPGNLPNDERPQARALADGLDLLDGTGHAAHVLPVHAHVAEQLARRGHRGALPAGTACLRVRGCRPAACRDRRATAPQVAA